jgi:hypothetical protein
MGSKPESSSEYTHRIINGMGKALPGPEKGTNGKYILPADYKTDPQKKRGLSAKAHQRIQDNEAAEMIYEYIMESSQLRTAMTLFLLDQHMDAIWRMPRPQANNRIAYDPEKIIRDWHPIDYINRRNHGELVPEIPYPANIPAAIVDHCSSRALGMLRVLDEEHLINGVRYKDHLKLINLDKAEAMAKAVRQRSPDHIRFVDGFIRDNATSYRRKVPDIMTKGRHGKESWIPFPLWIDKNATIEELKKDFSALLTGFKNKCIREGIEAFPKSKPGNKSAGAGLPSPTTALNALRMWRIKKIMDRAHATGNVCDVFDVSQSPDAGGITMSQINRGAKLADRCFAVLEGRSK